MFFKCIEPGQQFGLMVLGAKRHEGIPAHRAVGRIRAAHDDDVLQAFTLGLQVERLTGLLGVFHQIDRAFASAGGYR